MAFMLERLPEPPVDRLVTIEELLDNPQWGRCELNSGKVMSMAPTGMEHGDLALEIGAQMRTYVKKQGLGKVMGTDVGFLITRNPDTMREADVMFISTARLKDAGPKQGLSLIPPDLAVEIVSPSDRWSEVVEKVETYLRAGVKIVWVVDPKTRTAQVYRFGQSVLSLHESDALDGAEILPGFRMELEGIFN